MKTPYQSKLTPIDYSYSFWSSYKDNSIGRAIHYLYVICSLSIAEQSIFNGDNTVSYQKKIIANINWDNGYPHFTFIGDYEYYNPIQDKLLSDLKN